MSVGRCNDPDDSYDEGTNPSNGWRAPEGAERAADAADLRAKEELRGRTWAVCWCGHLQAEHAGPWICTRCSCGDYVEQARMDRDGRMRI